MPEFNPDEYLAKKAADFDPDAYLKSKANKPIDEANMNDVASGADSIVRGGAQGITFGNADELAGGLGALVDKGSALLGLRGDISLADAYKTRRDAARRMDEKRQKENPALYKTSEIGGGVLSAFIPGAGALNAGKAAGALKAAEAAGTATKGMKALADAEKTRRLLGLATVGGGVAGSGYSKGEVGSAQHLLDTGLGAGLGAASFGLAKAGEGVLKGTGKILAEQPAVKGVMDWTTKKLSDVAAMRAAKAAIGQNKKLAKEIEARPGGLMEFGRKLIGTKLDDGTKVLGFGNTTADIGEKAVRKVEELGPQYDEIFKQVDELAPDGAVSPNAIAEQILGKADNEFGQVANRGVKDRLYKEAEGFMDMPKNLTMSAAQKEKNAYKWTPKKGLPGPEELRPDLQNQIKNIVGGQIDEGIEKFGGKELAGRYQQLNKDFGHIKSVANAAEDRATQDFTNRMLSPTDYGAGAVAFLKNGAADLLSGGKAALVGLAHNQVRTRGNASTAVTMDALSKALKTMPEAFGKYGNILQKANERGANQLGVTHHILWKNDPEYKALFSVDRSNDGSSMSAKPLGAPEQ